MRQEESPAAIVDRMVEQLIDGADDEWKTFLSNGLFSTSMHRVADTVKDLSTICPDVYDILNWAKTPISGTKIVILGQDPYPAKSDAIGVAFATRSWKVPRSLKNIFNSLHFYKLIAGEQIPPSECWALTRWQEQGVLLLNTSLTTEEGKSNVHKKLWAPFTDAVIEEICKVQKLPMAFLLWGGEAKRKGKLVGDGNLILTCEHPVQPNFVSACNHWKAANDFLQKADRTPIDWALM